MLQDLRKSSSESSDASTMPTPDQHRFDHLVVLMLENRSFDNLCGYLYEDEQPKHFIPDRGRVFRGLAGRDNLVC
jgi:phospholipase C